MNIASHWNSLILTPLKRFLPAGPVLIVIDVFDECSSSRDLLLKLVTGSSGSLPPNLRILVNSRPERDVRVAIRCAHSDHLRSMDLNEKNGEARLDIEYYIRHQLTSDEPHIDGTLDDRDFQELANESEGLFQWAAMVCRAINHKPAGRTLKERFRSRPRAAQGKEYPLDPLYKQVLGNLFKSEDAELMDHFRSVMAQILCTPFPISTQLTDELRRIATGVQENKVTLIVADMGPLLSGVSTRTSPIRPLHTSFRDFLTDAARSGEWFVDLARGHSIMALGCLRVMNNRLAFNICRLETSYILNRDIPDLDSRLSTYVPQSLLYAACNWNDHLATTHLSDLQQELSMFLRERLLFWFELLGLLKCVNRAAPSLEAALKGDPLKELLRDAISFVRRFAGVIAQAAPHVYISALPFPPTLSKVRTMYLPYFPSLPLIDGVCDHWPQAHAVLSRHTGWVCSVAYSPDGRHIVSGSGDKTVRVWDAETGEAILELSCGDWVSGVAFSPDGRHIAAALDDLTVQIWDSTTGEAVCEPLRGHEGAVWCIAYSPDGRRIVSGDSRGRICIWSTETLRMVYKPIPGHASHVNCVAFSPTSQYIASGSEDKTVRVWDAVEGRAVREPFEGHTSTISSVLFSLDGLLIVSGSWDSTIRIWDFKNQQSLHTISHHLLDDVWSLSLSPDGGRIAYGLKNGSILIWDVEKHGIVAGPFVVHSNRVRAVSFSPDGRHVVSGSDDATIRIWSTEESTSVESPGDVSSDSSDSAPTSSVRSLAYSPDGRRIISGSLDGTIDVWDADTGKSIGGHLKGHSRRITRIRFSPDGGRFVSSSGDHTLRVWDSTTLQPLREPLHGHTDWVQDIDYSPDGRRIVSCSHDGTIRIWDAETYECLLGPLYGHKDWVTCIAWSPDGKHIASGSWDRTVRVWDAETGHAVGKPFRGHKGWVLSVSWSMDGRYVLSSSEDGTIRFWDTEKWEEEGEPLRGHADAVYNVMYTPDYQQIVSGGEDGTIWMWDAQTRQPVGKSLSNWFGSVNSLALSPDGRRIISGSYRSTRIVVWNVNTFTGKWHLLSYV
ncbi:WD40 repeat-like protein [Dichomitus squalens LYAD-421 SS1]|uniref:WD40 repeat-like protein n=1 Tax=Dichomitus squalens (strain LYAD-421) TaxID=732165 RepID=R7SSG5_DICSQ|nr:WD40 repeat-like protein [Dichomitus squalens LYAD-421 SS1]EJF58655.1 WD40 repeat-like protein [Dichomitus squalens LYAD-421 SS1]